MVQVNDRLNKHIVLYSMIFIGVKPWQIWQITGGLPTLIIQIIIMSCEIYKETNKQEFTKALLAKSF